jgi:hypothetical protein
LRKLPQHCDKGGSLGLDQHPVREPGGLLFETLLAGHDVLYPADRRRDKRPPCRHSLNEDGGSAFIQRGFEQDVGALNHAFDITLPIDTFDAFRRAVHQACDRRALRAVSRDQEADFRYGL